MTATILVSVMLTAYVVSIVARQRREQIYGSKFCNNGCGGCPGFNPFHQK